MKRNFVRRDSLDVREMCIFAMLGSVMFASKVIMEALPNIHLLGMLTVTYTLVYRKKALIPIYLYVVLNGLFSGFNFWWLPYTYIWTILWGIIMLLPRNIPRKVQFILYPLICAIHGFAFGILYSPAQALMFGLTKSIAQFGARYGIRCVCISPGPVLTRPAMANMKTMLGRAADPQEIIDLCLFVASEKGQFINGENIMIDGGRNAMGRG